MHLIIIITLALMIFHSNKVQCPNNTIFYWGEWAPWSRCSISCDGSGVQLRVRKCQNGDPNDQFNTCTVADEYEHKPCSEELDCPGEPFSDWDTWSHCSRSCGMGIRHRVRKCLNQNKCSGRTLDESVCSSTTKCKSDAIWTTWTLWTEECDFACGPAHRLRFRQCYEGRFGGIKSCIGYAIQKKSCGKQLTCDKTAGTWNMKQQFVWDPCDVTCGKGYRYAQIYCISSGTSTNSTRAVCWDRKSTKKIAKQCNLEPCPVNRKWSSWGLNFDCSVSCGKGVKIFYRECVQSQAPINGPGCNEGFQYTNKTCSKKLCPGWTKWGPWKNCSQTCGGGLTRRFRSCHLQNKSVCVGKFDETRSCNNHTCPRWGQWQPWTQCSRTCDSGIRTRQRQCLSQKMSSTKCEGTHNSSKRCKITQCSGVKPAGTDNFILLVTALIGVPLGIVIPCFVCLFMARQIKKRTSKVKEADKNDYTNLEGLQGEYEYVTDDYKDKSSHSLPGTNRSKAIPGSSKNKKRKRRRRKKTGSVKSGSGTSSKTNVKTNKNMIKKPDDEGHEYFEIAFS